MKSRWPMIVSRPEQANARARRRRPPGYVQRLGARLGGDGDYQAGATLELIGQMDDEPGLAGARR
jgi:hypothetical protein